MPRKPPGPADLALIGHARERGVDVSATQLERWRAVGVLPPNVPRSLGRGRGSTSVPAEGAADLVVWLARHAGTGRRPHDLALLGFADGLAVPERTVRAAFRAVVQRVVLPAEVDVPAGDGDRADWAWSVAELSAVGGTPVLLPQRMRRIDERIVAAGLSFAPPELAIYDKGPAVDDPVTAREFATFATAAVLAGSQELAGPALAPHVRALLPAGAVSPVVSWLEYPDGPGRDPSEINDGGGLSLLPTGDVRDDLLHTVDEATVGRLRVAWQAAVDMRAWATALNLRPLCGLLPASGVNDYDHVTV